MGILQNLDVSESALKHKQMGDRDALIGNEHYPGDDEALTDSYSIISNEDRIVMNTIRKLDTLLTYAHDSNMATAAKQQ